MGAAACAEIATERRDDCSFLRPYPSVRPCHGRCSHCQASDGRLCRAFVWQQNVSILVGWPRARREIFGGILACGLQRRLIGEPITRPCQPQRSAPGLPSRFAARPMPLLPPLGGAWRAASIRHFSRTTVFFCYTIVFSCLSAFFLTRKLPTRSGATQS